VSIYRGFATWLAAQLGRPPLVRDLDADVIAAFGRHLTAGGGRGGAPAAPATVRVYVSMIRALASGLGLKDQAAVVRAPRHEPGPPETLTDADYQNLLRVPDRRSREGKRDYALLRVLGDCGLGSAELRRLRAEDLRRPRANARYYRLYVHGKGGREREVSAHPERRVLDGYLRRCTASNRRYWTKDTVALRRAPGEPPRRPRQ
jgi:integrase/recombinase XerD